MHFACLFIFVTTNLCHGFHVPLYSAILPNRSMKMSKNDANTSAGSNTIATSASTTNESVSYGANNFGDIMGGCETHIIVGGSFTPMERVVLTANGNLQRIMSAYYGAPVSVDVKKCNKVNSSYDMLYDREVDLIMGGQVFCTAVGRIELLDRSCVEAIEGKKIGVGQLFRYLGALPRFVLLEAGRKEDGVLWRKYSLSCDQLKCEFTETFTTGFWNFLP